MNKDQPDTGTRLANAVFEGMIVRAEDQAATLRIAERNGLLHWVVSPLGEECNDYLLAPHEAPAIADVWDLTYRLRADREVAEAEPAFVTTSIDAQPARNGNGRVAARARPESDDGEWSLRLCKVPEAWAWSEIQRHQGARSHGESIRIAHADTGCTRQSAFCRDHELVADGYDFLDTLGDVGAQSGGDASHGTVTSSVIVGAQGCASARRFGGVAPKADLIPLRVKDLPTRFSYVNLCRALYHAADKGCHVVSMGLGGPLGGDALHRALRHAAGAGVIPVAASGNGYPFVVYPARYEECIAACACNARGKIWPGAAAGDGVDVVAPGEPVWRADTEGDDPVVARGDSTAYAAAFTAGLAALWLAHHDRQTLLQHYPGAMLPAVFKALLMQHGVDADARWQSHKHGSGIVNALKLLQAPLPAVAPAFATKMRACGTPRARNDVERLAAYFPEATVSQVRALVRRVLGVSDRHLSDVLASVADEFIFHVATEPAVRARLLALIKPAKCAAGVRGAAGLKRLFRQASPLFRSKLAA